MTTTIATSEVLGPLGPGESDSLEVILTGQKIYNIFVHAHEPGVDFDLYVFDENGNLIDIDDNVDSDAYCRIVNNWTGPFQIVIECARGFSTYQIAIEEELTDKPKRKLFGLF
ncbi:MAG: hypothetical protein QNJ65_20160 [Xenococcaceae cyanobacterium MO_234.B1]|nr:hypothetical protein [Xenococcaceae cyanobacterium MO_234.B1]